MAAVNLDDVKAHLNIKGVEHDDKLRGFIAAAEAVIAQRVGPLEPTEVTVDLAGGSALALPVYPVLELTSVASAGNTLAHAGFIIDAGAGLVSNGTSGFWLTTPYTVTYSAGRNPCPDDLKLAVKELVRHLWETQRGPTARPGTRDSDAASNTVPGAAYMFPFRVEQLLAPHEQYGFA